MKDDTWQLGDRKFRSRIIVGTGKYSSLDETKAALDASGAEIVTVALRRVDLKSKEPTVLDAIDRTKYVLLPNTAGCFTADDAIRTLHLAR
ncbi:MAG TPA: thiazole synthase, partial [Kofleriaceae bacterium]